MLKSPISQLRNHRLRRITFLGLLLTLITQYNALPLAAQPTLPPPQEVRAVAARVNNYWIANRPGMAEGEENYEWARAVYFMGNMAHYEMSNTSHYADLSWQWAESFDWQLHNGCTTIFADDQAAGQTYLALHQLDPPRADLECLLTSLGQSASWAWLEIDLGTTVNIDRFILNTFEDRAYRYLVDVKVNVDDPYGMVLDRSDATLGEAIIPSTPARIVRLRVIGAAGYTGQWVSLNEFQIFGPDAPTTNLALNLPALCSSAPEPENGCANLTDGNPATRWSTSFPDNFSTFSPNWWWIDALFMAAPIYATLDNLERTGTVAGKSGYASLLYAKYDETKTQRGLYDAEAGLWYRDTRFLAMPSPNGEKIFWSRGNGWTFAAHALILDILPPSAPHYSEYLSTYKTMAAAILAQQTPSGYWNQNLVDPQHCGGPESSGTSLFAFGLAWGINHRHLDRATYLPAVIDAWTWLTTSAVQSNPDGLLGYVQREGDRPECSDDASLPTATDSTDFGVGVFLLATREIAELAADDGVTEVLHLPLITSRNSQ